MMMITWGVLLIVPFLTYLATLGILWFLALRGRMQWSSPYCRACGYDLRGRTPDATAMCPECGANLTKPRAVAFARAARSRPLLILATVLTLLPPVLVMALIGAAFLMRASGTNAFTPGNLRNAGTATVVQQAVAKPDEPWAWQELERRLSSGSLTTAEADQAVDGLTAFLKSKGNHPADAPLSWSRDFLRKGVDQRIISDAAIMRLLEAYHGVHPSIKPVPRLRAGSAGPHVTLACASAWQLDVGFRPLAAVRSVTVDGQPVKYRTNPIGSSLYSVDVEAQLPSGVHTLEVETDMAFARDADLVGLDLRVAKPTEWPKAARKWVGKAQATFTVLAQNEQPVATSSDPAMNPSTEGLAVKSLVVRAEGGKLKLMLALDADRVMVPVSVKVAARFGETIVPLGSFMQYRHPTGNGRTYRGEELKAYLPALPADVREMDIVLTPDPRGIEEYPLVTQIWGGVIVLPKVPVQRYDQPSPSEPTTQP